MTSTLKYPSILVFCFLIIHHVFSQSATENIISTQPGPQIEFGISIINKALHTYDGDVQIILSKLSDTQMVRSIEKSGITVDENLRSEGFQITVSKDKKTIAVLALDDAGLMLRAFELSEQITIAGIAAVQNTMQNPNMKMRGTKFNIPLDVRIPSYSDVSDAAQKNMLEMWSFDFWKEYIDTLARYRYNFISLWIMHPFPSLVKVPEYPDVALDDVRQSTVNLKENYSLNGTCLTKRKYL